MDDIDKAVFVSKVGEAYLTGAESLKGKIVGEVDPAYFRPTEVELLIGDPSKARTVLGWEPQYDLNGLVKDMMQGDIALMKRKISLAVITSEP